MGVQQQPALAGVQQQPALEGSSIFQTTMSPAALVELSPSLSSQAQQIQIEAQQQQVALQQQYQQQMAALQLQPFGAQGAPALIQISDVDVCNCPCEERQRELELEYHTVKEAEEGMMPASEAALYGDAPPPPIDSSMVFLQRKRSLEHRVLKSQ